MAAPDFSIVLPAHNEAANIAPMITALKAVLAPLGRAEIIFVDDGSSDGTLVALRAAAAADPAVRYVSFTRNFGHQVALRAGLRHARGRAVVVMDADFEHPPELIPDLVAAWRAGAKIVVTARTDDAQVSADQAAHLAPLLPSPRCDRRRAHRAGQRRFHALDRTVVDLVNGIEDQDVFLRGLVRWLGYPLVTVPFERGARPRGRRTTRCAGWSSSRSPASPRTVCGRCVLRSGCRLRSPRSSLLLIIYAIVSFLFVQHTVAGWSSIMAAIALLGAAQLLVLGIIGEYVGRILRETRRRPSYIVAETEADRKPRQCDDNNSTCPANFPFGLQDSLQNLASLIAPEIKQ